MLETQLRIGTFTKSLLIEIARSTGQLKRAGLDVKESAVASSPAQFQALESGEFDLVMTSPDNALAYRFLKENPLGRNIPVKVLAAIDRGLGLSLCVGPRLRDVESVRGRVLGVDVPQSGFAFVAYALLDQAGLHPGDYQVEALGSTPRRVTALVEGHCAATVLNAGNELRAVRAGCVIVSQVTNIGPYLGTVLAAMEMNSPEHDAARFRFADVLLETSNDIGAGRLGSETIEASMSLLGLSQEEARHHYAILLDPKQGLVTDGIVDRASISTLIKLRQRYLPCPELSLIENTLGDLVADRALADVTGSVDD
jgi:ABC-type nitrate/sulfonate/bicarbonate transport system substrate-binding protein